MHVCFITVRIRDIALDYNITRLIYYMIIDDFGVGSSRIQACDCAGASEVISLCTFLSGDLMKKPIRLSVSPKHRYFIRHTYTFLVT